VGCNVIVSKKEAVDKAKKELNIKFLNTDWMDSTVFKIPLQDLVECVHFIHAARSAGNSVLVHCAQVSILNWHTSVYIIGCVDKLGLYMGVVATEICRMSTQMTI